MDGTLIIFECESSDAVAMTEEYLIPKVCQCEMVEGSENMHDL